MKYPITITSILLLGLSTVLAATNATSLVVVDSSDFGDTNTHMRIEEIERNENTSKLRLTYEKMGSSVGSSMFIMRGFYEVAKSRGTEYFINLKEWDDPNGGHCYIAGFTNTKDADIKKEFGAEYELVNKYGQDIGYMSVSDCNMIWGKQTRSIEQGVSGHRRQSAPQPAP
jgi:hypothetical protein